MDKQLLTRSAEKIKGPMGGSAPHPVQGTLPSSILQLQRTLGNGLVAKLIQAKRLTLEGKIIGLQPKLTVGAADDQYEQEADHIAHQVVSMPDSVVLAPFQQIPRVEGEAGQAHGLQSKPLLLAASITPFVQRQMAGEEEIEKDKNKEEDNDELLQAKFFNKSAVLPLQRQLASKGEKTGLVQAKFSIQRNILPEEDKDKVLQTKSLVAAITPFGQWQIENNEEPKDEEVPIQAKLLTETYGGPLQRQSVTEEEEAESIRPKSGIPLSDSFEAGNDVESQLSQSKGGGSQLPSAVRSYMEPRFGVDFSHVRVHTGSNAIQMNREVGAQAFTHGSDIYYGAGSSLTNLELTAHELMHVVQQTGCAPLQMKTADEASSANIELSIQRTCVACGTSKEEEKGSDSFSSISSEPQASVLQRQGGGGAPACPTAVNFGFTQPAHAPHCGGPALRATTNITGVTWSLTPGTAAVDPGSTIVANGTINLAATQVAGDINARATASAPAAGGCHFERPFTIRSHPVGIASTSFINAAAAGNYGGTFDHLLDSADGNVASLESVGVGERFTNVPNPAAATHNIVAPLNPFGGVFTLNTATLTPGATNNWFLTAAGGLGGTLDSVTTGAASINVGRFVQSASNPTPPQGLPASMTLLQRLHWFCPQRPAANRWIGFVTVPHSRTLRNVGGTVEFVTAVNAVEQVDPYVGPTAVSNLTATPTSTPHSAGPPAGGGAAPSPARTVAIKVDTLPAALPAGQIITWSIIGNARGCAIAQDPADDHAAILTIGTTTGTVTVEATDSVSVNRARVAVVIT